MEDPDVDENPFEVPSSFDNDYPLGRHLNELMAAHAMSERDLGRECDILVKIWRELERYRELEAKARLLEPPLQPWIN